MSDIILFPEVSIILILDILLFISLSVASYHTIKLIHNYKFGETSQKQYLLEKKSYLVITIISISVIFKIILLPFYIHTLDEISNIIPGAMCAAGVIKTNPYGSPALILKIVSTFISMLWLKLNNKDEKTKENIYFKIKLYFFIFIYITNILELTLELKFFLNISTLSPVLCCSAIYTNILNPLPFDISTKNLIIIFYITFILLIILNHLKKRALNFIVSLVFVYLSYYAIVYFFGIYIYQLPTHKCPFCMFEKDYYFIGYFIYTSLFLGTFYTISASIYTFEKKSYKIGNIFYILYILFLSYPFLSYLIKNHTFI